MPSPSWLWPHSHPSLATSQVFPVRGTCPSCELQVFQGRQGDGGSAKGFAELQADTPTYVQHPLGPPGHSNRPGELGNTCLSQALAVPNACFVSVSFVPLRESLPGMFQQQGLKFAGSFWPWSQWLPVTCSMVSVIPCMILVTPTMITV